MPRHNELDKTWLPGPSRGTQTFNAPANLTIDYGRHVATVSGRGGSGNNPGAQYSILYNTNYNVIYPQGNQPEASRPVTGYNTNYNIAYPIATQPEASRPITGYNATYNIAYPVAGTPENYTILYNANYNIQAIADTYGANYMFTPAYNRVDTAVYNVTYPVFYNSVSSPFYNAVFTPTYNVAYPVGNQPLSGTYNPPNAFNWEATIFYEVEKLVTKPGQPIEYSVFVNNIEYNTGSGATCPPDDGNIVSTYNSPGILQQIVTYDADYTCTPIGNTENNNTNYNIAYPLTYNVAYPIAYNVAYPIAYNVAYPIAYNVAYPIFYNVSYPVGYNIVYPAFYNQQSVFVSNNTNYNVIYPVDTTPEASRPVTGYNVTYNIAYPTASTPAVYTILYNSNYNIAYPAANYGANYSILYNTNYNVSYPVAKASRPIVGYSPGVPGTPTNVLGVTFPGGPVGLPAPFVPETVVRYWDYPDFQTHPVVVPSGGEITIKLE